MNQSKDMYWSKVLKTVTVAVMIGCLAPYGLPEVSAGMLLRCQAPEGEASQEETAAAQMTLADLPGYDSYQEVQRMRAVGRGGRATNIRWSNDSLQLSFQVNGKTQVVDVENGKPVAVKSTFDAIANSAEKKHPVAPVRRAEQRVWTVSPDLKWKAEYRDFNVRLTPYRPSGDESGTPANASVAPDGADSIAVTTTGDVKTRYGTCCWVYGEELDQQDAMWWSPDSSKLAFYEVAETHMKDYHLSVRNTEVYPSLETTRYPTAGEANPYVALLIYDLESKETVRIEIEGPADQYLFNVEFTKDSKFLKFHRTNRWQNQLDVMLADVESGKVRSILQESQESWQANSPTMQFLEDGQRFIWQTERSGYAAFELRDTSGEKLCSLSPPEATFPCGSIMHVDEVGGWIYYGAFSDENPYNQQIFRAKLDGSLIQPLTAQPLSFSSLSVAPDHRHFVVVGENAENAPETYLYESGKTEPVAVLATRDMAEVEKAGLQAPEFFHFPADDGKTEIWGLLYKPRNFDPGKKYPLVVDVYGGPNSQGLSNRFTAGNPGCEFGFLIAKIGNRGTVGRGKAFESATYMRLGGPDLDDQLAGVKYLAGRDYVDSRRVGIYGHSYGGYMTALALLRYPKDFHVGVSGAPVTHWKNYDTIYTERYMRTPQTNQDGYELGSCLKYAGQLEGHLLLVHGLMDDNVHPSNTWQLADALYKANKRFDMLVYPGFRHGIASTYPQVRWEYLVKHLKPAAE